MKFFLQIKSYSELCLIIILNFSKKDDNNSNLSFIDFQEYTFHIKKCHLLHK